MVTKTCENVSDMKSSPLPPPLPYLTKGLSRSPVSPPGSVRLTGVQVFPMARLWLSPWVPRAVCSEACTGLPAAPQCPRPAPSLSPSSPLPGAHCGSGALCLLMDGSLPQAGKSLCWENCFFTLQICTFQHFCKAGASPLGEPGIG